MAAIRGEGLGNHGWICAGDRREKRRALINRIDIGRQRVTTETCIRDQLMILPGDVLFNRDRMFNSWRNIANLRVLRAGPWRRPRRAARETSRANIDLRLSQVKRSAPGNVKFRRIGGPVAPARAAIHRLRPPAEPLRRVQTRCSLQLAVRAAYISDFSLSYTDPRIRENAAHRLVTGIISGRDSSSATSGSTIPQRADQIRLGMGGGGGAAFPGRG
jgi:hypothetical protein